MTLSRGICAGNGGRFARDRFQGCRLLPGDSVFLFPIKHAVPDFLLPLLNGTNTGFNAALYLPARMTAVGWLPRG